MKLFNWKLLIVIVGIVIVGKIYCFLKAPAYKNQLVSKEDIEYYNKNNFLNQIKLKGHNLDSIVLIDEIIKRKNEPVLLLRIPKFACGSCVNRELSTLEKWESENKRDSIILLSDFQKQRFFNAFSSSLVNKPFILFNYWGVFTNLDKSKKPYLLSIDKNGIILNILMIEKQNSEATQAFLNELN